MSDTMTVVRVYDEAGSHPEPSFDESWDDLTKLRWLAALVAHDTGLRVHVQGAQQETLRRGRWVPDTRLFSVNVGNTSTSGKTFAHAWTYLNGVSLGARESRRETHASTT